MEQAYLFPGFLDWASAALVLDCGAHIGLFALQAATVYAPNATFHCLEPAEEQFSALSANLRELLCCPVGKAGEGGGQTLMSCYGSCNRVDQDHAGAGVPSADFGRVTLHRLGVWRDSGQQRLTVYPRVPGNSTFFPAAQRAHHAGYLDQAVYADARERIVPVTSLSDFFRAHSVRRVDVLKVDVEGAELACLEGINPLDFLKVRQIVVEVSSTGGAVQAVLALLHARGFVTRSRRHDAANYLIAAIRRPTPV